MLKSIETKKPEIADLCRRYHVHRLELFGSAATGEFDPARSDFDFLVEFEDGYRGSAFDQYFGLKERLEALLGRPVDLVVEKAVRNPYFRAPAWSVRGNRCMAGGHPEPLEGRTRRVPSSGSRCPPS